VVEAAALASLLDARHTMGCAAAEPGTARLGKHPCAAGHQLPVKQRCKIEHA